MNKTIIVELENLKEEKQFIELAYTDKDEFSHISMVEVPNWSKIKDEFMYYDYLDDGKQAMYFRLSSIMTKEPFVFMKQNGWDNIDRMLDNVYTRYLKKPMPENMDEAIEALPGLVEMFSEMLEKMKSDNAKYLIIDLRKNTGGFTPITLPTLYMLYGDKYLVKDMDVNFYRLISPLHMKKYNMTLDDYNGKNSTNFQFGDYTFSTKDIDDIDINKRREQLINNAMGDAADYIRELNGKPLYTPPKIFVLIDVGTFSAAFHYTFYLWKMGATVVGIPSKQAPNTYMEGTFFELPLTTLSGSISNSFQAILPPNDRRAKIFYPDIMLSREKYETYKYDKQSELLYLIDILDLSL